MKQLIVGDKAASKQPIDPNTNATYVQLVELIDNAKNGEYTYISNSY